MFTLFLVLFSFLQHIVGAMIHGKTATEGIAQIANKGIYEVLAWRVLILAAFLPFFAMEEVERVFGAEKVRGVFFRGQGDTP